MSDAQVSGELNAVQPPLTAGAMLRAAREAAGLHIAALAVSMKVSVKKLEALEQDRVDPALKPVFVRALACSVCRALKIDPAPVLEKLPQNQIPSLNTLEVGKNAPFNVPGQNPSVFTSTNLAKPAFLVVPVLLVGIAVVLFFPKIKTSETLAASESITSPQAVLPVVSESSVAKTEAVDVVSSGLTAPTPSAVVASTVAALAPQTQAAAAVAQAPAPNPTPDALARELSKTAPESPPLPNVASRGNLLVFKAKAASWVEVVDSARVVQVRRILNEGETVVSSGALPLAVVVGRVDAVSIEVRGKVFDLSNISKDGVARFEVK